MSSEHYIIVARNTITGAIELPLDDMTLYGQGCDPVTWEYLEEALVHNIAGRYGDDWVVTLYGPVGGNFSGRAKQ